MGCCLASIISLIVLLTIVLRQKKTSKVIPLGLNLNLRLVLISPAFSVNILLFEQSYKSAGKCAFPGCSDGMWRAESVKMCVRLPVARVLAKAQRLSRDILACSVVIRGGRVAVCSGQGHGLWFEWQSCSLLVVQPAQIT